MNTITKSTIATLASALLLTGCAKAVEGEKVTPPVPSQTQVVPTPTPDVTVPNPPAPTPDLSTQTEEVPTEDTSSEIVAKFGQKANWKNGLSLTVSKPKGYAPSDTASGGSDHNIVLTLTLTNRTGKSFDPAYLTLLGSDNTGDTDEIFDTAKGLDGRPSARLRTGKTTSWRAAFALNDSSAKDFSLQVTPQSLDFSENYRVVIFEN